MTAESIGIWVALAILALVVAAMAQQLYRVRLGQKTMQEQISGLQIGYGQLQQDMRTLVGLKQQVEVTRGLVSHVAETVEKLCRQDDIESAVDRSVSRLESQFALVLARQGINVGSLQTGGGGAAVGGNVEDNRARKRRRDAGEMPREEMP